ncbi:MAG: ATP-binding protein [Caldilineaceae bacterium]
MKPQGTLITHPIHHLRPRWFWQGSLQSRIVLTYAALFLVILVAVLVYTGETIYHVQLEQAEHGLEVSAFLIANTLEDVSSGYSDLLERFGIRYVEGGEEDSEGPEGSVPEEERKEEEERAEKQAEGAARVTDNELKRLQSFVNLYIRQETARVTLLAVDGSVIADSRGEPQSPINELTQVEVVAALHGSEQHDIRRDPDTGELTLYAAAPIQQGSKILGIVRLARPLQDVTRPTRLFLLKLSGGGVLALLLMSVIGMQLGRYLVQPLRKLEQTAQRIAAGELTQTAPVTTMDEVGVLAVNFNYMVARLRELLDQQRQFVANASHELRTPLTNIKLRSEALLTSEIALPERTRRYLMEIDSEADRLRRLANTLLNLASLEWQTQKLPTAPIDIVPLVREIVHSFRVAMQQTNLTLVAQIPETLPPLHLWPDHLLVILNNLFDNAIKYTPAGGHIHFRVTLTPQFCQLQLQDSGIGIPATDLPHIFERFYRVDKVRSRQISAQDAGSGAGLGLAIVKALVELNGGAITVASTPGVGSCFTVNFPHASDS